MTEEESDSELISEEREEDIWIMRCRNSFYSCISIADARWLNRTITHVIKYVYIVEKTQQCRVELRIDGIEFMAGIGRQRMLGLRGTWGVITATPHCGSALRH